MSKAINWPIEFYEEVLNEDCETPKIALRLGSLYFDNGYYLPDEIVDIRVDHKIVRQGKIVGEMKLLKIDDLNEETLNQYKSSLRQNSEVLNFLKKNYNKPVDEKTEVTVITYKNLPVEKQEITDDQHIS